MGDAEFRAIAKMGRDLSLERGQEVSWNEARDMVEHTFIGACMLLHERAIDLGRAVRRSLPAPVRRLLGA
jgi:hypothetical protein